MLTQFFRSPLTPSMHDNLFPCDDEPLTATQTIRDAASWLHNCKYHNQCDGYLTSLTELLTIMSRFVGTVNPAFGTSSVESVDVRTK